MTLRELKEKISQYQYLGDDTNIIDVVLSSILAARLGLGAPVWLAVLGASSGGKTQILRPLAMTDKRFIHSVDDLTPNTFLSGANLGKGKDPSLLHRIGKRGIIVISDMTGLFSKEAAARTEILGQFRTLYDGYCDKHVGNRPEPLHWEGEIGILAGGTPALYTHFEENSVMGERFLYYRMKEYDAAKAVQLALSRKIYGKELNETLCEYYTEYLKGVLEHYSEAETKELPEGVNARIERISLLTERIRTSVHLNWKGDIDKLPSPAFPMRLAQQMKSIARGLSVMRQAEGEELGEEDYNIIDWVGWSLANEEKRACLRILAERENDQWIKTQTVADLMGLDTTVTRVILQNLSAIGVLVRHGDANGLTWRISDKKDWELIRGIEGIATSQSGDRQRELSGEETAEIDEAWQRSLQGLQ